MDVVYYWIGGTQEGIWREARFGGALDSCKTQTALIARISDMGYVAKRGNTSVGPPEGPPDVAAFRAIHTHG